MKYDVESIRRAMAAQSSKKMIFASLVRSSGQRCRCVVRESTEIWLRHGHSDSPANGFIIHGM